MRLQRVASSMIKVLNIVMCQAMPRDTRCSLEEAGGLIRAESQTLPSLVHTCYHTLTQIKIRKPKDHRLLCMLRAVQCAPAMPAGSACDMLISVFLPCLRAPVPSMGPISNLCITCKIQGSIGLNSSRAWHSYLKPCFRTA